VRAIIVCVIAAVIVWIVTIFLLTPLFLGAALVSAVTH
jgi:hypothetical protein